MKKNNKLKILLISLLSLIPFNVNAITATVEEQQNAIIETALAYNRQGSQIQYDLYKSNLYSTPEDATNQHLLYTNCSAFTYQVYYQTLDIKLPTNTAKLIKYAETNKSNTSNILFYYDSADTIYSSDVLGTSSTPNYSNLIKEWTKTLNPGDILVVRFNSNSNTEAGHTMIVKSIDEVNGKITMLESHGTTYNTTTYKDNYEKNGSINEFDLETTLKEYYERIGKTTQITKMSLIRIITDGTNYINSNNENSTYNGITEAAKARLNYPKIDIEKTITIDDNTQKISANIIANLENNITYEITIKNNSTSDYSNLNIIENIDSKVSIKDKSNATFTNNQLKWTIPSLKAGTSTNITYTVSIPNDQKLLGTTIVSTGNVNNINTSKIETRIGNRLTKQEKEKLINTFNELKNNNDTERKFINEIYKNALGLDLELANLKNLDIISFDETKTTTGQDSRSVLYTKINDTKVKDCIYNNYYGLRISNTNDKTNNLVKLSNWNVYPKLEINDRARTIELNTLEDGDIVLTYTGETSTTDSNLVDKSYIYLNNKLIRKTSKDNFEEITGTELTKFLQNISKDNYIILKPALILPEKETIQTGVTEQTNNTNIEVTNPQTGLSHQQIVVVIILIISISTSLYIQKKIFNNSI